MSGGPTMSDATDLEQLIAQAGALCTSDRRALLLKLTARFLDEACPTQERQHLSIVICRIGATLEQDGATPTEPVPCEERLIALLRAGDRDAFIACFVQLTGIDADEARLALDGAGGEALARACKQAGLERATYSAIVVLSDPARGIEKTEALLLLYDDAAPADEHITHAAA